MKFKAIGDFVVGILIGIMAQMPGASGATVAVIFKVYERIIEDAANIRKKLLKDLKFVIPIGIGGILGYFFCAIVLGSIIDEYYVPLLFFFGMLIMMQIPDIKMMSNDGNKVTRNNIIALIGGIAVIVAIFVVKMVFLNQETDANMLLMFVAGLIVIAAMLAPGISGSTILLAIGIYPAFLAALKNFDFKMLIPMALGAIVGFLVFSRLINFFMKNCRKSTYFAILGLSIGSVGVVIAEAIISLVNDFSTSTLIAGIICAIAGIICGYGLCKLARKYSTESVSF